MQRGLRQEDRAAELWVLRDVGQREQAGVVGDEDGVDLGEVHQGEVGGGEFRGGVHKDGRGGGGGGGGGGLQQLLCALEADYRSQQHDSSLFYSHPLDAQLVRVLGRVGLQPVQPGAAIAAPGGLGALLLLYDGDGDEVEGGGQVQAAVQQDDGAAEAQQQARLIGVAAQAGLEKRLGNVHVHHIWPSGEPLDSDVGCR